MPSQPLFLVDQTATRIAGLNVRPEGDRYRGTICLDATPPPIKHLFEQFEELVEGQMFSLADEVEDKIAALLLKVVFEDGTEARVEDLQVYPSTKRVSFKTRQPVSVAK
jgi:hypothetical protein